MHHYLLVYLLVLISLHQASSLYPTDRFYFPFNAREAVDNGLGDSMIGSSGSEPSTDYIRSSEIVRFVDYSSTLGSPLASLSSLTPLTVESTSSGRDASRNGTLIFSTDKSIICNEDTVESLFSLVSLTRHHDNVKSKETARHRIMGHFWKYGFETYAQKFTTKSGLDGVNLIGIWPGKNRNKTGDSIVLLGGHYDTVRGTQGIDDNGSGIVALLEIVRLIGIAKPSLNHSIFFVAFDFEESGLWGSKAFVSEYFIPEEMSRRKANFMGAYIIDMILTWDPTEGSQSFSDEFKKETPEAVAKVRKNKNRGDFASIWMRRGYDKSIWEPLEKSWNRVSNSTKYKLIAFDADLPDKAFTRKKDLRETSQTFLRSDHSSFWYHGSRKFPPLNALLITDLGPWRGYQKSCYHKACDDLSQITRDKLGFVVQIILTLHNIVTVNPPSIGVTINKRREPSSLSSFPSVWPQKPTYWSVNRQTPILGFDGPYNTVNRGGSDVSLTNWLSGASDSRFQASGYRPLTWNSNNFPKSWPTLKSSTSPSPSSPSPSSSPSLFSYDVSDLNSRTLTNPWYTLINRRSNF